MEPFIGQLQLFGFNFNPRGWAFCDGQLLPIAQNSALFSLLGTTYGGDGRSTFGLPDLRGRVPIHMGQGAGLTNRSMGSRAGSEDTVLSVSNLPAHTHTVACSSAAGNTNDPTGAFWSKDAGNQSATYSSASAGSMNAQALGNTGNNASFNNMQPYLTLNWCIALIGVFPSRN